MHVEISIAVHFVSSYLYNKLPRRRVDAFGDELEAALARRVATGEQEGPQKVSISGPTVDRLVQDAARASGLDVAELLCYLPERLTLSLHSNEVAYQLADGPSRLLYSGPEGGLRDPPPEASAGRQLYTVGAFAQTKFGSTKLKGPRKAQRPDASNPRGPPRNHAKLGLHNHDRTSPFRSVPAQRNESNAQAFVQPSRSENSFRNGTASLGITW